MKFILRVFYILKMSLSKKIEDFGKKFNDFKDSYKTVDNGKLGTKKKLSGSKVFWSNKDSAKKKNHNIIYVPSLRLMGTKFDIINFLSSNSEYSEINSKEIIKNSFTYDNYNKDIPQILYNVSFSDGKFIANKSKISKTFRENYENESKTNPDVLITLETLAEVINELGKVKNIKDILKEKIDTIYEGKYLDVSKCDEEGNGTSVKTIKGDIIKLGNKEPLSKVGIKNLEKGQAGAINFLKIFKGMTEKQAMSVLVPENNKTKKNGGIYPDSPR